MTAENPSELSYNPHIPLSQALLLPRIAIEDTMPTLDGGQFAVKSIAGREVVVTSKVFADGHDIPSDIRADLARRNIPVVDGRITEIARHGGQHATVRLDTAPDVAVDILFAHPRNKPSARLHESLGLATVDTPLGIALKVDERRETSIPGIYAAGDLANPAMASVTTAISHGATAGISAQQSVVV